MVEVSCLKNNESDVHNLKALKPSACKDFRKNKTFIPVMV